MDTIITRDVSIPRLGFGTFRMPGGGCQPVVESALALGYRHLDTAAMYENEDAVGAAIATSNVPRGELFVTTKVWHDQLGTADSIRLAFDTSVEKLKLDYVDLYMVHWPSKDMNMAIVMETLTALRDEGRARAIGLCNFNLPMLRQAIDEIHAPVASLQVVCDLCLRWITSRSAHQTSMSCPSKSCFALDTASPSSRQTSGSNPIKCPSRTTV